ncbi:MAG: hypothetical protein GY832_01090 [Chloroflexi bacterium]|nr:hypothetical protein [Chloroflexota bacterium]
MNELFEQHPRTSVASFDEIRFVDLQHQDHTSFDIRPLSSRAYPITSFESPHRHNFQELIWIKSGSGGHAVDNHVLEIQPHTFYLIAKGQVHQFLERHDIEGYLIRFTDDFLLDTASTRTWNYQITLFNNMTINHTLPINQEDVAGFEWLLQQIAQEYSRREEFGKYKVLRHLMSVLLVRLERARRTSFQEKHQVTDHRDDIFQNFVALLEERYWTSHRADQLCLRITYHPTPTVRGAKALCGQNNQKHHPRTSGVGGKTVSQIHQPLYQRNCPRSWLQRPFLFQQSVQTMCRGCAPGIQITKKYPKFALFSIPITLIRPYTIG